jgi:hypothetical protein
MIPSSVGTSSSTLCPSSIAVGSPFGFTASSQVSGATGRRS